MLILSLFLFADLSWLEMVRINKPAVFKRANELRVRRGVKKKLPGMYSKHSGTIMGCYGGSTPLSRLNFVQKETTCM